MRFYPTSQPCNVTRPGLGREGGVTVTGLVTGLTFVLYKEKVPFTGPLFYVSFGPLMLTPFESSWPGRPPGSSSCAASCSFVTVGSEGVEVQSSTIRRALLLSSNTSTSTRNPARKALFEQAVESARKAAVIEQVVECARKAAVIEQDGRSCTTRLHVVLVPGECVCVFV